MRNLVSLYMTIRIIVCIVPGAHRPELNTRNAHHGHQPALYVCRAGTPAGRNNHLDSLSDQSKALIVTRFVTRCSALFSIIHLLLP